MAKTKEHIFDEWLVLQFQSGDKKALTILVKRWHKRLVIHSNRFVKDIDAAKDIVQDSWIVIFRNLKNLRDPAVFRVWIMSIVAKKSVDWIRKQQQDRNLKEELKNDNTNSFNNYNTDNSNNNKLAKVKQEINKLPQKQQIVLQLFHIERYSIKEISSILNLHAGTVKSRLFNAREHLRKSINKK
jgi:RNA polymerase sigma factor (sigma-70 family)